MAKTEITENVFRAGPAENQRVKLARPGEKIDEALVKEWKADADVTFEAPAAAAESKAPSGSKPKTAAKKDDGK